MAKIVYNPSTKKFSEELDKARNMIHKDKGELPDPEKILNNEF